MSPIETRGSYPEDLLCSCFSANCTAFDRDTAPNRLSKPRTPALQELVVSTFIGNETCVVGGILMRVQTERNLFPRYASQWLKKVASAFMINAQQLALALRACTSRSLIIVDELAREQSQRMGLSKRST